jgi:hypothetical protein
MNRTPLYNIVFQTLIPIIPKSIINHIIFEYTIEKYEYKSTRCYNAMCWNIHFNKQLGLLHYICDNDDYELVNYCDNTLYNSVLIDTKLLHSDLTQEVHDFWPNNGNNIIYFQNDIILTYFYHHIYKYALNNSRYNFVCRTSMTYINSCNSIVVQNNYIYVVDKAINSYRIIVYDLQTLKQIAKSGECEISRKLTELCISIYSNMIYIYNISSSQLYTHDIITLFRLKTDKFINKCNVIRPYKDKLYCYEEQRIDIYDITTLEYLHSFNINIKPKTTRYQTMIINDNVMLIQNDDEVLLYNISS